MNLGWLLVGMRNNGWGMKRPDPHGSGLLYYSDDQHHQNVILSYLGV